MASWQPNERDAGQPRIASATNARAFLVVFAGSLVIAVLLILIAAAQQ